MSEDHRIETMARRLFGASPAAGWTSWDRLYEPARARWRGRARERLAEGPAGNDGVVELVPRAGRVRAARP
jgi:hypothetical protein